MNCHECVQRLDQLVDRELSDAEMEEAKRHLASCGECSNLYRFQTEMKRVVRVCCWGDRAPADLRERLERLLF
jgi:mycothiol system anti-sigma-R factor